MRRRVIKQLLALVALLLILLGLYGLWARWQLGLTAVLHSGLIPIDLLPGGLVLPRTTAVYGGLAAFFLLLALLLLGTVYVLSTKSWSPRARGGRGELPE